MRRRGSAVKEEVEAYLEGVEKRGQHAAGEEGVGVAVGDVQKQVHAEAARARALKQAAGELDQRGEEWRWEVCGGEREEKLPVPSSARRMSRKAIWRTGRKASPGRRSSSASQAQSSSFRSASVSSVYAL